MTTGIIEEHDPLCALEWEAAAAREQRRERYLAHLKSSEWRALKARKLTEAGHRCQTCSRSGSLDLHHNSYDRFGEELHSDVVILCRSCHDLFHHERTLGRGPDQLQPRSEPHDRLSEPEYSDDSDWLATPVGAPTPWVLSGADPDEGEWRIPAVVVTVVLILGFAVSPLITLVGG
jgi:5-methylcytosine-specific restriction endonuclease McrA